MALVALDWVASFGDVSGALARLDDRLAAHAEPGDLMLLPEACLTGYVSPDGGYDLTPFAEPLDGPTARHASRLAERHAVSLVLPLVEAADHRVFNTMVGVDATGRRFLHYRKRHPWYPEHWATPGDLDYPVADTRDGATTIGICFDLHFLAEEAITQLTRANVLLLPTAWVEEPDTREARLVALARRFGVTVVNANWSAGDVVVPGQGQSMIVGRDGVLATAGQRRAARW
jgi:predicted amidohydrolase